MSEFTDYLTELFERFGPVAARRMFGGHGIFHDGIMFALVVDDTLYLKADEATAAEFIERGLPPFEYIRSGKTVSLSYYQAPAEVLDDPDEAVVWARKAFASARATRKPARKKKVKRKK